MSLSRASKTENQHAAAAGQNVGAFIVMPSASACLSVRSMSDIFALSNRVNNENSLGERTKDKMHFVSAKRVMSGTPVTLFKWYNVLILAHVVAWRDSAMSRALQ